MSELRKVDRMEMTPGQKRDSLQKCNTSTPRKKKAHKTGPKEEVIQSEVEGYLNLKGIQFIHIPDVVYRLCAPYSPIKIWEKKVISEYLRGIPDLLIFKKEMFNDKTPCIDNSCLMLELKRKGGKAGQAQRAWHRGLIVHVPQSFEEAKKLIDNWA